MWMKRSPILELLAPVLLLSIACSSGSDDNGPTGPGTPMPAAASATFQLTEDGQTRTVTYTSGGNTVFCTRNAGWASLFLRFAEQAGGNGEAGPRLDLDLCNHTGGGAFGPKDPQVPACGGGKTFDVFWHGADGSVYANEPTASACALQMTQTGTQLMGTFQCAGLTEMGGNRTVDVVNGSFTCTEA